MRLATALEEAFHLFVESADCAITASEDQNIALVSGCQEVRALEVLGRHLHNTEVNLSVREVLFDLVVRVTLVIKFDLPKREVALGSNRGPSHYSVVLDVLLHDNFIGRVSALVLWPDRVAMLNAVKHQAVSLLDSHRDKQLVLECKRHRLDAFLVEYEGFLEALLYNVNQEDEALALIIGLTLSSSQ